MHVPLSGLKHAMELVGTLGDLDDPAGLAELALPRLDQLIGCDSLSYNEIGPAPGAVEVAAYPGDIVTPATLAGFAAFAHEHPLIAHYRLTGDDQPVKMSDFLSQEGLHRLGLYTEVFRPLRVEYQIAVSLPGLDGQVVGIALNRADSDFTEDHRALLAVLRGPLAAALERSRERLRAREGLATANPLELDGLTTRELRILHLAALGRTNTAIAHALDISPRTVAKHLEHIYRKLDVTSRTSAVFAALSAQG
jgi:DNA-binding CsgD family transcriptional regulator